MQPERKFCDLVRKVIEKEIDGDSEREGKGVRDREGNNNNNNNGNNNNNNNNNNNWEIGDEGYHLLSISKSRTSSLVSSVPLRLPTAQTSRVSSARILQTTPPLPPLSNTTRLRINSPAWKQERGRQSGWEHNNNNKRKKRISNGNWAYLFSHPTT